MPKIWIVCMLSVLGAFVSGFSSLWQQVRLEALVSRSIIGAVVGAAVAVVYCMLVKRWFLFQEEKMKTELPTMKQPLSEESQEALEQEAQENFQPLGVEEWQKLPK
ncbi:hypothetical protein [Anaeromusa acidaminophila]|uniref:hypothetical protein n=1 Tax=Anaeromusa acidaminophila TaxID=81464 RepID=UPI0003716F6D|nr:hypothetical protein [Anaeromusa acidaminophila]